VGKDASRSEDKESSNVQVHADKLLKLGVVGDDEDCETFASNLVPLLKRELKGSRDFKKIVAVVSVLVNLVESVNERKTALHMLMVLLGHTFPLVRKFVAETLYVKILEIEQYEAAEAMLLDSIWDDELEGYGGIRERRNSVALLLGVKLSQACIDGKTASLNGKKKKRVDELESYSALVKDAGF
jgi:hypothetical protein